MKKYSLMLCAAFLLMLFSCGGENSENTDDSTDTQADTTVLADNTQKCNKPCDKKNGETCQKNCDKSAMESCNKQCEKLCDKADTEKCDKANCNADCIKMCEKKCDDPSKCKKMDQTTDLMQE